MHTMFSNIPLTQSPLLEQSFKQTFSLTASAIDNGFVTPVLPSPVSSVSSSSRVLLKDTSVRHDFIIADMASNAHCLSPVS